MMNKKIENRIRRHKRVRAKIYGTPEYPRLSVFRSNRYVYVQLIDDAAGRTLIGVRGDATQDLSRKAGKDLAVQAVKQNITRVVFDRGGYRYHGRIRAVAEGAREGGLAF